MSFWFLGLFLGLIGILCIWGRKYYRAYRLYREAQELERQNSQEPKNHQKLKTALAIYQQCYKLTKGSIYLQAKGICQQKINNCDRFKEYLAIAHNYKQQGFFTQELAELIKGQQLFTTEELKIAIIKAQGNVIRQKKYEATLEEVKEIARTGDFTQAIALLKPALTSFSRQDGRELQGKLNQVIQSKNLYKKGLIAEDEGNIHKATALYNKALAITPELDQCKIRLALIALTDNPQQAINYLQGIEGERANYIRGFAYSQLKNWQEANKQWRSLTNPKIQKQRSILKQLLERDRLFKIQEIELLVEETKLEQALSLSECFLNLYGTNLTVENNLKNYLIPTLESQNWQDKDWETIALLMEQKWLEKQDAKSLHNWAIATYHQARVNSDKLINLIAPWLTAIANLKLDPSLKNIPWLEDKKINWQDLQFRLIKIIEDGIDRVKDSDLEKYFSLRDIYRRDIVMLSLIEQNNCGIKNQKQLLILPNCYQISQNSLSKKQLPEELWATLYTDWGMAVAACLERDTARAIQIKPQQNPNSKVEHYAVTFVAYHEGCHYLQNQYWRKSISPLKLAQSQIRNKPDWYVEVDLLCQQQCKYIGSFEEHLEFSNFWYFLLESSTAKNYYLEYQGKKIGLEVDEGKISFQQGLNQLKELENIEPGNSLLASIITTLEINLQLEKINYFWQQGKYEEAVILAKGSPHQKVRFAVAEVCLEIVLHILQTEEITNETLNSMQTITQWAYELCPLEPSFQPVYNHLKRLGVYN